MHKLQCYNLKVKDIQRHCQQYSRKVTGHVDVRKWYRFCIFLRFFLYEFETVLAVWYVLPFYRSSQFYWKRKPKHLEKSTNLPEVTDQHYHISWYRVHLVIYDENDDRHLVHVDKNGTAIQSRQRLTIVHSVHLYSIIINNL